MLVFIQARCTPKYYSVLLKDQASTGTYFCLLFIILLNLQGNTFNFTQLFKREQQKYPNNA